MATKAELETELQKLQARYAELEARSNRAPPSGAAQEPSGLAKAKDDVHAFLDEHGIDLTKVEAIGESLTDELTRLQKDYPITVLISVFALGYALGRSRG